MNEDQPHILVVDDDDRLRALLTKYLSEQGFFVTAASSAQDAREKLEAFQFDLMVLDVMMPDETGLSFLETPGRAHPPVLLLSALGEAEDRIAGLERGADDYLAKPFEPKELVLRIRMILRRFGERKKSGAVLAFGPYRFEMESGQLTRHDETIYLTASEAQLLRVLAENSGSPVSREELAQRAPGSGNERSIDVQITRLRKKIGENEGKPLYLQTVRGAGYVLYAS